MMTLAVECCGQTKAGAEVVLRAMTPSDVPVLASAFSEMDPWHRLGLGGEHLARFFASTQSNRFRKTVVIDGDTAGVVIVEQPWLFGSYLKFFGIFAEAQGHGAGSLVLRHLLEQARKQGFRNYWIMTSAFNAGAIALYERHGFERVAVLPDLIVAGDDEILFRQMLG
jgi:diamine N-acetyltransferase